MGDSILIPHELLNDSTFDVESFLSHELIRRVNEVRDAERVAVDKILWGDGSPTPQGVITLATAINVCEPPDPYHERIFRHVTILDVVTGEAQEKYIDEPAYWWHEGNGGCDCNRRGLFFPEHERKEDEGHCIGEKRYVVVWMEPMPADYTLDEFNETYPAEVRAAALAWRPPEVCDNCGAMDGTQQFHGIRQDGAWLCGECYSTATMEE